MTLKIHTAYLDAFKTDPTSAFGGIIAFNRPLDKNTAQDIIDKQFVEVIIAPSVDDDAKEVLSAKQNVRALECGDLSTAQPSLDFKRVTGGLLVQDKDLGVITEDDIKCVSDIQPTALFGLCLDLNKNHSLEKVCQIATKDRLRAPYFYYKPCLVSVVYK